MSKETMMVSAVGAEPRSAAVAGLKTSRGAGDLFTSGWWPAGSATLATVAVLWFYGVPVLTVAVFGAYIAGCVTLPGLLWWRLAHRGSGSFVADVAAGTALGYALEVLTYIACRAAGAPLLVLVFPVLTVAAFLLVPGLRRYWRGAGVSRRMPVLWSWPLAGAWGLVLVWSATKFFSMHGLSWPYDATPDSDMPFHLALIGEAKHRLPVATPWVSGESLLYHWFVYAEMAATSWVTRIEPQVLLYRLSLLPMLAAFLVMIAVTAHRLTGRLWTGPVAVAGTLLVLAPNPYAWELAPFFSGYYGFGVADDGSLLRPVLWASPTQTFGALLFAPLVVLLVDLLSGRGDRSRWALFTVFLLAVMGGKATYLPLLLPALLLVVVVHSVARRRLHGPALAAAGAVIVCLLFAQFVMFGGASQGLKLAPLTTMKIWAMSVTTGFATDPDPRTWRLLLLVLLFLLCWFCIWSGVVGLGRRLLEPEIVLLIGVGVAGIGAVSLLGHAGLSQGFFLQSARPYLTLAAVCGFAALVPVMTWRKGLSLLGAVAAGVIAIMVIRVLGDRTVPTMAVGPKHVALALTWPFALLGVVAVLAAVALYLVRDKVPALQGGGIILAILVALLAGSGLPTTYSRFSYTVLTAQRADWKSDVLLSRSITQGAQDAGRWLRDHSGPDDFVATNAHCQVPHEEKCNNQHLWISAYTERRILVEGWGFTNTLHAKALRLNVAEDDVPYWNPEVLADNDAAFVTPTASSIGRLRDHYGIRWLFVDETQGEPGAALNDFATLRYRSGKCAIYEIKR